MYTWRFPETNNFQSFNIFGLEPKNQYLLFWMDLHLMVHIMVEH